MRSYVDVAVRALAVSLLTVGAACNATVDSTISPPSGCVPDNALVCSRGGQGWSCAAGDDPEAEVRGLSCSVPRADGPNDDFCCFDWKYTSTTCTPDDTITSVCQYPSYGYSCTAGDDPTSLDSSLHCSSPTPDGSNDDFCCE